jgi:hypothetical protein
MRTTPGANIAGGGSVFGVERPARSPYAPRVGIREERSAQRREKALDWAIPAATALAGAAIGIFGSWFTQADLSQREYLRGERTTAYANLLSEEDRLADLERRIDAGTNRRGSSLADWSKQHLRRLEAHENALDDAVARVEMFGSSEAVAAVERLVAGHTSLLESVYGALRFLARSNQSESYDPSFELINEPAKWRESFVEVVRDDLGLK